MSLRSVRKRKKGRTLGAVDVIDREGYAELEVEGKVALIRSLIPLGLLHIEEVLDEEVPALAGERDARQDPSVGGRRHGSNPGTVGLAGQRVPIRVPRIRHVTEREIPRRSYEALHGDRAVNDLLLRRVLYGISCRNYAAAAEAIPGAIGLSGSTVSRAFIQDQWEARKRTPSPLFWQRLAALLVPTVSPSATGARPQEQTTLKRFSNRPCTTGGGRGTSARTDAGGPMRAYSMDLRERALLDSDAGMKAADVAAKCRVSGSWVRLLKQRRRETGEVAPRVQRHGRRGMLEPHLHTLADLILAHPDRTLAELKDALATPASVPTVWRAVRALGLTVKKTARPSDTIGGCVATLADGGW